MARKRPTLSDLLNDLTFKVLFDKYKLIAMNAFEWEGLPEGIKPEYIERWLFDEGKAIFFKDPDMSFMCLQCQDGGQLNVYERPLFYHAIGLHYNKTYKAEDCVIIQNNLLRLPTRDFILFYVNKLTEAERTADVNMKSCKTPIVFAVDDKDVLTFKRIFQQVDGNVPAIFADKNLNLDAVGVFDTKAKFLCNEIKDYEKSVENDLLTFLGQNNPAVDKKERLITDEVNSNNELIEAFFELQYEARKRACEEINAMFGLSVSVKPRETYSQTCEQPVDNEGGGDDVE